MNNFADFQLVLTTCADKDQAKLIAKVLVEIRLAACVNIVTEAESVYLWQDKVVSEKECVLIIKSRTGQFEQLEKTILEHHPYELPEIIAVPLSTASAAYLDWLDQSIDK